MFGFRVWGFGVSGLGRRKLGHRVLGLGFSVSRGRYNYECRQAQCLGLGFRI